MPSYQRDVEAAKAAIRVALAHIEAIRPRALDPRSKLIRRTVVGALAHAERAGYSTSWSDPHPVEVTYDAARKSLERLDKLERAELDAEQRQHVTEAIAALHQAEDEVRAAHWANDAE